MIHPIDLQRISRAMGDPDAIRTPANDDLPMVACSWRDTAETFALILIGGAVVALTFFAWIS